MDKFEIYDALCDIDEKYLEEFDEVIKNKDKKAEGKSDSFEVIKGDTKKKRSAIRFLSRVAVIVLCSVALIASTLMYSTVSRADFWSALTEFFENNIIFNVNPENQRRNVSEQVEDIRIGYIPEGYELKDKLKLYESVQFIYENAEKLRFNINVSYSAQLCVQTFNQQSGIERIRIHGKDAYLVYNSGKNQYCTLLIISENISVTIYGHVPRNEIIKIALSIENL